MACPDRRRLLLPTVIYITLTVPMQDRLLRKLIKYSFFCSMAPSYPALGLPLKYRFYCPFNVNLMLHYFSCYLDM